MAAMPIDTVTGRWLFLGRQIEIFFFGHRLPFGLDLLVRERDGIVAEHPAVLVHPPEGARPRT